jgi:hypothetical protein
MPNPDFEPRNGENVRKNSKLIEFQESFFEGCPKKPMSCALSLGIQNCLFDGNYVYVGLRMKARINTNFSSVFLKDGSAKFETGYGFLDDKRPDEDNLIIELKDSFVSNQKEYPNNFVENGSEVKKIIQERLESASAKLWTIKFSDGTIRFGSIFINRSKETPRLEIGIWKYIDISSIKDQEMVFNFGSDIKVPQEQKDDNDLIEICYWIWVKDGAVYYWSFPKERYIPRYVSSSKTEIEINDDLGVLVGTKAMLEKYGRPDLYTPFAPDDVLQIHNVVRDRFSAAARKLLTYF